MVWWQHEARRAALAAALARVCNVTAALALICAPVESEKVRNTGR